jgi:arginyl-tRNA synthetase
MRAVIEMCDYVQRVEHDTRYLTIYLDQKLFISSVVDNATSHSPFSFGTTTEGEGKTVYVEYSSPNIAKPFHVGHLRSTIIGSFLTKIHAKRGFNVVSENYLGDWGKQYGLLAIGFKRYGDSKELEQHPIKHLYELYVRINQDAETDPTIHDQARDYFRLMEDGDEAALELWSRMRELSIEEYKRMYAKLNVQFDVYGGESVHGPQIPDQLKLLVSLGLLTEADNGAKIIDFEEYDTNLGKTVIVKKDGTTIYITRDIAAAIDRWVKHEFEKMFYVVASPQTLHFQQLFKILELCKYQFHSRCQHISFGLVQGMSTRKGQVVFLSDVFDEAKHVMLTQMKESEKTKIDEIENPEQTAETIGLSAIVVADLSAKRIKDYTFDWERVTSFEGDTGPYLQYNHSRLCGIERKALEKNGWDIQKILDNFMGYGLLTEPECRVLAWQIAKYPEAVQQSFNALEPCAIVQYLFGLCHSISSANSVLNVIHAEETLGKARLVLFHAARLVLNDGLKLLGLTPLERM